MNAIASFAGTVTSALVNFAFVPVYVRLLGVEGYGLVGFFGSLQAIFLLFDVGLSPSVTRQLARYSARGTDRDTVRDFLRTAAAGYLLIGLVAAAILALLSPVISARWLKLEHLPKSVAEIALYLMAALIAAQWQIAFCRTALTGLERQVALNTLSGVMAWVRALAAVGAMVAISPSPTTFFASQVAVSIGHVVIARYILNRTLPNGGRARLRPRLLFESWRFVAGTAGITGLGVILVQVDKAVASALLPLPVFGYYSLAVVFSYVLSPFVVPISAAIFPRLSALVAEGSAELDRLYHRSSQAVSIFVSPVAAVMVLFSYDLVRIWTGNTTTAEIVAPQASLLAVGTALNCLMTLPYSLQLAYGWIRAGLAINAVLVTTMVPTALFLTSTLGGIGAAMTWAVLNGVYMAIGVPVTHARLLRGHERRWVIQDVGRPVLAGWSVVLVGRLLIPALPDPLFVAELTVLLLVGILASALAASEVRPALIAAVRSGLAKSQ